MKHHLLLAALAALFISCCTAHRDLQQLADPAEPAAVGATATQPQYFTLFGPGAFAPTNPVAAAAHPGVEVTLAGVPVSERAAAAAASAAALGPASIPLRPAGSFERCHTASPSLAQKLAAERRTQSILQQQARSTASTPTKGGPPVPNVGTWFHVVSSNDTVEDGNVPDEWIAAQLDVLNEGFAGRVKFYMLGTTRTVNPDWVYLDADEETWYEKELEMKSTLRRGTMATLNLYIVPLAGYLGWAYFPSDLVGEDRILDGVICTSFSLPLAPNIYGNKTYNLGDTGTHEAGHWLGLYHTFDSAGPLSVDGCSLGAQKGGDFVSDTPAEAVPGRACVPRDSCPTLPGLDPIRNFLDYTEDDCMDHFTPGQFNRMLRTWQAWRANK